MHNLEPALVNETHKRLWDFETQTDHLISARRPDLIIINKKRELAELCCPGLQQGKIEKKQNEG